MTRQQFNNLSQSSVYRLDMYYGESKIGFIYEENNKYFFCTKKDLKKLNETNNIKITDVGQEIDLDIISSYESVSPSYSDIPWYNHKEEQPTVAINCRKLVILGAGASAGFSTAKKNFPDRPPLTYELFNEEYDKTIRNFPGARQFASLINEHTNLETFFQSQWDRLKKNYYPDKLSQIINMQFYLQELITTEVNERFKNDYKNNYNILSDLLSHYCISHKEKVMTVSFNYDNLFEQSLSNSLSYDFNSIADYIDLKRDILLFKPHGSSNWVRDSKPYMSIDNRTDDNFVNKWYRQKLDYNAIFKELKDEIKIVNILEYQMHKKAIENEYLPQLLIPFNDKDEFIMPEDHRKLFSENLSQIEEVLIIGWKGTEKTFQDLLKEKLGNKKLKIFIVNNGDPTILEALRNSLTNTELNVSKTFSEFMQVSIQGNNPFFS